MVFTRRNRKDTSFVSCSSSNNDFSSEMEHLDTRYNDIFLLVSRQICSLVSAAKDCTAYFCTHEYEIT